jgi:hypothetical protein
MSHRPGHVSNRLSKGLCPGCGKDPCECKSSLDTPFKFGQDPNKQEDVERIKSLRKDRRILMADYNRAIKELEVTGVTNMRLTGNSMTPIIKSGTTLEFIKCTEYSVGDIVFCKVHGSYIGAHKIIKVDKDRGYLIANNHGHENGWTKTIYGKVKL